ncbi:Heavy metal transport/detoxification protein domain protein, partial [mine drainage metagenome]
MIFRVKGMTCDHCARTVERTLGQIREVASSRVSYSEGTGE